MERGYLYLLVGALLTATLLLPSELRLIPFLSLDFLGYVMILMGIREMRTSTKELKNAYYFTIAVLLIDLVFHLMPTLRISNANFFSMLMMSHIFFSIGIFFWLFKAEYIWSPKQENRMDWLMYSVVAFIFLILSAIVVFPLISIRILPTNVFVHVFDALRFVNILRYVVLLYVLVKLYLEARKNGPGFRRWN